MNGERRAKRRRLDLPVLDIDSEEEYEEQDRAQRQAREDRLIVTKNGMELNPLHYGRSLPDNNKEGKFNPWKQAASSSSALKTEIGWRDSLNESSPCWLEVEYQRAFGAHQQQQHILSAQVSSLANKNNSALWRRFLDGFIQCEGTVPLQVVGNPEIVLVASKRQLIFFRTRDGVLVGQERMSRDVLGVAVARDGHLAAVLLRGGRLQLWNINNAQAQRRGASKPAVACSLRGVRDWYV